MSSEDEGPCYIDSETPAGWIKTLSEQSSKGIITDSRKDLLNDCAIETCEKSEGEEDKEPEKKGQPVKKKKNKKLEEEKKQEENKKEEEKKKQDNKNNKIPQKIPTNIKKVRFIWWGKENYLRNKLSVTLKAYF